MKHRWIIAGLFLLLMGVVDAQAEDPVKNPYLQHEEQPVEFRGTEWNDDYAPKDIPLTAKVGTELAAKAAWGGIFKISFKDLESKASKKREIPPLYFVVTDEVIALLNEEKMTEAIARIAAQEKPPAFEDSDIYGISHGSKKLADARTKTTIKTEKGVCTYLYSHESGHFTKLVWKKGVGLVEYGQGSGAHQDGFRLKREPAPKAGK
jgi:hypothetical protein